MKVLLVPGYYGFGGRRGFGTTGAGSFIREQGIALVRNDIKVDLAYCHFDGHRGIQVDVEYDCGIRSVYFHIAPLITPVNLFVKSLVLIWKIPGLLRDEPPSVVHAQVFTSLPTAYFLSRRMGIPLVYTEHSSAIQAGRLNWYWKAVLRILGRRTEAIIAVSEPLRRALEEATRNQVKIVPNIAANEFFEVALRPDRKTPHYRFLSVGRAARDKGWDVLLAAMRIVANSGHDARLVLAGEGHRQDSVRDLVAALGLTDVVEVHGRIAREDLPEYMAGFDCHVLPSRQETFGMVSVEALATGVPVIVTATGGADAIVHEQNGLIVPVNDPDTLASAMIQMIVRREEFEPSAIREDCRERFSELALVTALKTVYSTCDS